ncbi:PIB2 Glutamine sensor PIB2 [Candida maltosa Xu316]
MSSTVEKSNDDESIKQEESSPAKSDLLFTKKDLSKSRTQSFQSVLSTASLKSLKQQALTNPIISNPNQSNTNNAPTMNRNSSTLSTHNLMRTPVLSSIQKPEDDYEIGQQQPFDDKSSRAKENAENDDDGLIQQRNLTLNALKKLNMSPRPVLNPDDVIASVKDDDRSQTVQEPYQPAEVDLSSFASLTRQPKSYHKFPSPETAHSKKLMKESAVKSESNLTQYHQDIQQHQLSAIQRQLQPEKFNSSPTGIRSKPQLPLVQPPVQTSNHHHHILQQQQQQQHQQQLHQQSSVPAAVVPPTDFSARRKPSNPALAKIPQSQQQIQHQPILAAGTASTTPGSPSQNQLYHPRSAKHLQQIKGLRNPMYVPAVLRMTQNGLSTPNRSLSNSPDFSNTTSPNEPYQSHLQDFVKRDNNCQNSSSASVRSTDSAISVDSITSSMSGHLGSLTGFLSFNNHSNNNYDFVSRAAPTRRHWVKDDTVFKCGIPSCPKVFNFFERRHHCRKCGGIFCKQHTSHSLYINYLAQFTTGGRGTLSKVCDNCIEEYNEFIAKEFGVNIQTSKPITPSQNDTNDLKPQQQQQYLSSQLSQRSSAQHLASVDEQHRQSFIPQMRPNNYSIDNNVNMTVSNENGNSRSEQLVGSVPANWTWSSF